MAGTKQRCLSQMLCVLRMVMFVCVCARCHVQLSFVTLSTIAHQAPLPIEFSRQEYWSGLPFPPPGDLPNPGIEPTSPASPALQVYSLPTEPPGKPHSVFLVTYNLAPL